MSRRMIYLCYGKPASGKSMLTRHLDRDKVHVCELFSTEVFDINIIKEQIQRALQKFYPQPIKYSNELKDGVDVIVIETCDFVTKNLAEKILEKEVRNIDCKPGFTTINFEVKVRGEE